MAKIQSAKILQKQLQKFNCGGVQKNLDLIKLIGMKKIIAFCAVAFSTLVILPSCSKSSSDSFGQKSRMTPDRILEAKVAPGQTQTLTIDNIGELSIARQASHFRISQTGVNPKNSSLIYQYSPAEGFSGSDEVLLALKTPTGHNTGSSCGSGDSGSKPGTLTSYIAVKITVTPN